MDIRTEERYEDDFNQGNLFIMKRSGERVPFDESKIVRAIEKANAEVTIPLEKMSEEKIEEIAAQIKRDAENAGRDLSVEEIQDKVEDSLMIAGYCTLARLYITSCPSLQSANETTPFRVTNSVLEEKQLCSGWAI